MRAQAQGRSSAANRDGSAPRGSVFGRRSGATRASSPGSDATGRPSHRRAGLVSALVLTAAFLLLAPAAFAAKGVVDTIPTSTGSGTLGGQFNNPRGVAVNNTTGDIYVVDGSNNRVQQFSSSGAFIRAWGFDVIQFPKPGDLGAEVFEVCTVAADCKAGISFNFISPEPGGEISNPQGIAIDQSDGSVYITEQGFLRVEKFSASGVFQAAFGKDVDTGGGTGFEVCTVAADCKRGVAGTLGGEFGSGFSGHLAVAPAGAPNAGNVIVADPANRRVQEFSSAGAFVRTFGFDVAAAGADDTGTGFEVCTEAGSGAANCKIGAASGSGTGQFANGQPTRVAEDSTGVIYAVESATNNRVQAFAPQVGPPALAPSIFASGTLSGAPAPTDVQIGASDRVFVVKPFTTGTGTPPAVAGERRILELDSAGALQDTHLSEALINSVNGLAARPSNGRLFVSSLNFGTQPTGSPTVTAHRVYVLDDVSSPPAASIDPVSDITAHSATFSGSVTPNGGLTQYRFEYVDDAEFQANGFTNAARIPAPDASVGSGASPVAVQRQTAPTLKANTLYHVRLVARQSHGPDAATTAAETFTTSTAAPEVGTGSTSANVSTAVLAATLNPNNQLTNYHFEYGNQGPCDANPCLSTPDASAGSGAGNLFVNANLSGLDPNSTYHFRLVASNATGTTEGPNQVFTTLGPGCPNAVLRWGPAQHLPDCRAYELVTPVDTNGQPPYAGIGEHRPAGEGLLLGDLITTPSVSADGELFQYVLYVTSLDIGGDGLHSTYLAERSPTGWSSTFTGMDPATQSRTSAPGGASHDFQYQMYRAGTDTFDTPQPFPFNSTWMRQPDGSFRPIGEGTLPADPDEDGFPNGFRDDLHYEQKYISPSGDHRVIFARHGVGACFPCPPLSPLTADAPSHPNVAIYDRTPTGLHLVSVLPDGSVPTGGDLGVFHAGTSKDGSRIAFMVQVGISSTYTLYVRIDNQTTKEIATGVFSGGFATAFFSGLSNDKVFYRLNGNLYVYDLSSEQETQISASGDSRVVRVTENGSRVFFLSNTQLDGANGITGQPNLYVWDGTDIDFIATTRGADTSVNGQTGGLRAGIDRWEAELLDAPSNRFVGSLNTTRATENGSVFVFTSSANVTGQNPGLHFQIYRWEAATGAVICVSCPPDGGDTTALSHLTDFQGFSGTAVDIPNLTADGETVFFESDQRLLPRDLDSVSSVYQWRNGQLSLLSSGDSGRGDHIVGAGPDGRQIFINTTDALVPEPQRGGVAGIYSVRVNGGIPFGDQTPPCVGDACLGAGGEAPPAPPIGSASFAGPGNQRRESTNACNRIDKKAQRKQRVAKKAAKRGQAKRARKLRVQANNLKRRAKRCNRRASR